MRVENENCRGWDSGTERRIGQRPFGTPCDWPKTASSCPGTCRLFKAKGFVERLPFDNLKCNIQAMMILTTGLDHGCGHSAHGRHERDRGAVFENAAACRYSNLRLFRFWVRESLFSQQPEASARQKSLHAAASSLTLRVTVHPETEETNLLTPPFSMCGEPRMEIRPAGQQDMSPGQSGAACLSADRRSRGAPPLVG